MYVLSDKKKCNSLSLSLSANGFDINIIELSLLTEQQQTMEGFMNLPVILVQMP